MAASGVPLPRSDHAEAMAEMALEIRETIGRIEAGLVDPRVGTLSRLLRACRFDLEVEPRLGEGIDRSLIRESLARSPAERIARSAGFATFLLRLRAARRASTSQAG